MQQYANKSGRSGIKSYEFVDEGVNVTFKNGGTYHYPIEGNDPRTMETLHGLLDWGEYGNRLINARSPAFVKLSEGEGKKVVDHRPYPTSADRVASKAVSRMQPVMDKFSNLKQKAMSTATNFGEWVKARIK